MTKTDWTAEEVRAQAAYEKGKPRLQSMLLDLANRIDADEMAVPDGYTAILSDGKRYWADKPGLWGDCKPYFLGHPPAQPAPPAQEQPGWKWVPDKATGDMILAGIRENLNDPGLNVFGRIWDAMLAASPTQPKEN